MLKSRNIVNVLVVFYVLFNIFIIAMIWYPPDKQGAINSLVTPGVSTGLIVVGCIYWVGFAKISPALGYQIENEEEGLCFCPLLQKRIGLTSLAARTGRWNPMGDLQGSYSTFFSAFQGSFPQKPFHSLNRSQQELTRPWGAAEIQNRVRSLVR